ncbi:MAG: type II secretion system protein GspG [Gemmatimonadales bacterium]
MSEAPAVPPASPKRKPAWPLFLFAGLSFIPVLGFFIGSVAAGWGLVSSRRRALVAAGIGAGGALLNLVGLFALGVLMETKGGPELQQARIQVTRQSLLEVVTALETYREEAGHYPTSLVALQQRFGLRRPVNIADPTAGIFRFRPYQYELGPDGMSYDLFAVGPDRKPGTADDIRPALPDSLEGKVGLKGKSER